MYYLQAIQNRQNLGQLLPDNSLALVLSNQITARNSDVEYPFRQDSNFWYLTGLDEPDSALLIFKNDQGNTEELLFTRPKNKETETWTGMITGLTEAQNLTQISQVYEFERLINILIERCDSSLEAVFMDNSTSNYFSLREEILPILQDLPKAKLKTLSPLTAKLRVIKNQFELDLMRKAATVNIQAHQLVAEFLQKENWMESYEYTIEAILENHYRQNGLTWAYPSIVASGASATTLHYIKNNQRLQTDSFLLIDAGCEYQYYASDITCTYILGQVSPSARQVYKLVETVNQEIIKILQNAYQKNELTDWSLKKLHQKSVELISQGLLDLGILKENLEEIITSQSYKKFYMHRLGHYLGLDVHDPGDTDLELQAGMVFTVEPGLYFDILDETIPSEIRGLGVRIEDNIAITENGIEVLSKN